LALCGGSGAPVQRTCLQKNKEGMPGALCSDSGSGIVARTNSVCEKYALRRGGGGDRRLVLKQPWGSGVALGTNLQRGKGFGKAVREGTITGVGETRLILFFEKDQQKRMSDGR